MRPNITDKAPLPPPPAAKPPAAKRLRCDQADEENGTYVAVEFRVQKGAARRAARAAAGPGALAEALAAVAQWICVKKKCPQLKYTIRLSRLYQVMSDPATATFKDGTVLQGYAGRCSCDWRIRVECVEDEIESLDPTGSGSGVIGDPPVEEQDLECDDEFVGRGKAVGAAVDVQQAAAIRRASQAATDRAREAAKEAINGIACIKRSCPDRQITFWIGPTTATTKAVLAGFTIAVGTCPWAIQVTCDD